jgi:hypothetical protein
MSTLYKSLSLTVFTVLFLGVTASPARGDLVDGLLNYWNLDGALEDSAPDVPGSASTVADDGSFDGEFGIRGIGFAEGLFGDAIEQDGASGRAQNNGFVRVPSSADTTRGGLSLSISAWVETAGFDTTWQTLLAHGEGGQYRLARRDNSNFVAYTGGAVDIPTSNTGVDVGPGTGWHHIVVISEHGVSSRIWVDGTLVATSPGAAILNNDGNNNPTNPDFNIGANPQTGGQNREWFGKIDDVATWDRPLLESEIQTIFEAGTDGMPLSVLLVREPVPSLSLMGLAGLLAVLLLVGSAFLLRRRKAAATG